MIHKGLLGKRNYVSRVLTASFLVLALSLSQLHPAHVDAAGETIAGTGAVTGRVNQQISITTLVINGTGNDTLPVKLQVDEGTLYLSTTTGLTFTGDSVGSTIQFSGTRSSINTGLASLHYSGTTTGAKTLTVSLSDANTIYNPDTGHVYQYVPGDINWQDAKDAATSSTYDGAPGYLATITSQDENDFIKDRLSGDAWLGASDADEYGGENTWEWVGGPEDGTNFYNGLGNSGGSVASNQYANWASGEPNQAGDEDCMETYISNGTWNDYPCTTTVSGYVVEYGDDNVQPASIPSADMTINVTTATFAGGDGTPGAPYQITDCERLQDMNQDLLANYVLTHDIDCTDTPHWNGGQGFVPIGIGTGGSAAPFRGTIDGAGYAIDGLTEIRADDDPDTDNNNSPATNQNFIGLFGYSANASINDLHLTHAKIKGYQYVGGLVGFMSHGTMTDSSVNEGLDESSNTSCNPGYCVWARYGEYGGGLVGWMTNGTIDDSSVGGLVKGSGNVIGGLVGYMEDYAAITNSHSAAAIDGGYAIGGAVGQMFDSSSLNHVYATGNVRAKVDDEVGKVGWWAGGLVGYASNVTIDQSYATGDVHGDADYAGGLVGQLQGSSVNDVYATGSVRADDYYAGGLLGAGNYNTIARAYASGQTQAGNGAGSFTAASDHDTISDSFAVGRAIAVSDVGGFAGIYGAETYSQNYYDVTTTAQNGCTSSGDIGGCTPINAAGSQPRYFIDLRKAPFTQSGSVIWDNSSVWYFDGMNLPVLRFGNSAASVIIVDDDNDGISNAVEDAGPHNGDANSDGIADKDQDNVASFVSSVTNKRVVLELSSTCEIQTVASHAEVSLAKQDAEYSYDNGMIRFTADCGSPGVGITVKQYYYDVDPAGFAVRKFNSTTNEYSSIAGANVAGTTIAARTVTVATYSVVDGGSLDEDGVADGQITDPAGLGSLNAPLSIFDLAFTGENQAIYISIAAVIIVGGAFALCRRLTAQTKI